MKNVYGLKSAVLILLLRFCTAAHAEQATSVSQWGITWTFDKPHTVGKFVNGDWWVIGPVTVVKVDPAPGKARNGSIVNPKAAPSQQFKQPFDNRAPVDSLGIQFYDEKLGPTFPLLLKPDESLVSTISKVNIRTDKNQVKFEDLPPPDDNLDPYYFRYATTAAAVLTCLGEVPPADAFRPPYADAKKTIYTVSQLRRDLLPHLPVPAGGILPEYKDREKSKAILEAVQKAIQDPQERAGKSFGKDLGALGNLCNVPSAYIQERMLQRVWLDYVGENVGNFHPSQNMPGSPREMTNITSTVALMLLLDDPKGEYEQLLRLYIQRGIDCWGVAQSCNRTYIANGGIISSMSWVCVVGRPRHVKMEHSPMNFWLMMNRKSRMVNIRRM